jgi:hypothetical protein
MPNNYGLAEILSLDDAIWAWKSFFGRFFSADIPSGINTEFDPHLRQFIPRENQKAKYQHPDITDERTLHSDDFDDFLNGNTVTIPEHISLNQTDLDRVEQAILRGDFADECFKKEEHVFYALWLFKQNKITRQQMSTLLARDQFPEKYPIVNTFRLLDDEGKFTKEALELWLPVIVRNAYSGKFTNWQLERLRLLIQASPKSEQIFYISECNPDIISTSGKRQLGDALFNNRAWYRTKYNDEIYDLHMTFGVIEGLQIAVSGINGAAASRAKLGKIGIDSVKEGIEFYYRPTAISMRNSGVEATTKGIHEYADSPMPAVTAHDVFHARLHNTIKPEFHMMLNHMNQIIAKHTKQKWSKTMWELVDREFHAFQLKSINLNSAEEGAVLFLEMLHRSNDDKTSLFRNFKFGTLSDDGFAIIWNMVNESDVWKKLYKIDIDFLDDQYQPLIEQIKSFRKAVGSNHSHSEILTLKYRFFSVTTATEFQIINRLLDSLGDKLVDSKEQKLVFGKYTQNGVKNLTTLKFKNFGKESIIHEDSVKEIIPILANMRLETLLEKSHDQEVGIKNNQAANEEVQKISKEFVSTYHNSAFSKEILDKSVANLSSITEKLNFLEMCYEQIINSKGYSHRHSTLDFIFTFFKNPLTTSQREHINLLKEKQNELISECQKQIGSDEQQQKELQWCLKNRGANNLTRCNTERFYLHLDSTIPSSRMVASCSN